MRHAKNHTKKTSKDMLSSLSCFFKKGNNLLTKIFESHVQVRQMILMDFLNVFQKWKINF